MSYLKDFKEKQSKLRHTGRTVKMIHNAALKLLSCELDDLTHVVSNFRDEYTKWYDETYGVNK